MSHVSFPRLNMTAGFTLTFAPSAILPPDMHMVAAAGTYWTWPLVLLHMFILCLSKEISKINFHVAIG